MKESHYKVIRLSFALFGLTLFASSCISPKKVLYLQDMDETTQIELENRFEAIISPADELNVWVTSYENSELAQPFNMLGFSNSNSYYSTQNTMGYLVDINGNIQFPILGSIHVQGLTRLQLQDTIAKRLIDSEYLGDPMVTVRFKNFKVFFLGKDGNTSITVSNERCTFLEALALSGGLDKFTRRDRIGVLREVDGKMVMRYLDPRSSQVFNDPFFMLQQNDMIITESIKSNYFKEESSYWLSWLSSLTSIASIVLLINSLYVSPN